MSQKKKTAKYEKRKPLDILLKIITKECENKGWQWELEVLDESNFRSATIHVEKYVSNENIAALLNVLFCPDDTIRYGIEKISFHDYSVRALLNAVSNALGL